MLDAAGMSSTRQGWWTSAPHPPRCTFRPPRSVYPLRGCPPSCCRPLLPASTSSLYNRHIWMQLKLKLKRVPIWFLQGFERVIKPTLLGIANVLGAVNRTASVEKGGGGWLWGSYNVGRQCHTPSATLPVSHTQPRWLGRHWCQ